MCKAYTAALNPLTILKVCKMQKREELRGI